MGERKLNLMIGASSHSDKDRELHDFYATNPKALELFLNQIKKR